MSLIMPSSDGDHLSSIAVSVDAPLLANSNDSSAAAPEHHTPLSPSSPHPPGGIAIEMKEEKYTPAGVGVEGSENKEQQQQRGAIADSPVQLAADHSNNNNNGNGNGNGQAVGAVERERRMSQDDDYTCPVISFCACSLCFVALFQSYCHCLHLQICFELLLEPVTILCGHTCNIHIISYHH